MIIVIGIIAIAMFVGGAAAMDDDISSIVMSIGAFIFIVCLIAAILLGISITKLRIVDDQIAMYQEENEKIETQIDALVKQYQEYESGVFIDTSTESSMTLVSLYPELKADALVQRQMDVYIENNQLIKELKCKQLKEPVLRWWLYFGK
jgi:hypothetical protein